ncbi:MAG: hypothetical protein ACTSRJ_04695 [Candidatus Hodarchaeales archaeon]
MWIATSNLQLGKYVTIYIYQFYISEQHDFIFENEEHRCYLATYEKEFILPKGETRIFSINFYFDRLIGHIIEFLVTTDTYDQNNVLIDSGNCEMNLVSTSVNLHPERTFDSVSLVFFLISLLGLVFYSAIRSN